MNEATIRGESMFASAVAIVLEREGVFSDDRRDPGGTTKYGISDMRDGQGDGMVDVDGDGRPDTRVVDLTIAQARAIYRRDYWDRYRCGDMPWAAALPVFDAVVNMAPGLAVKALQRTVGTIQDGDLGPKTLAAVVAAFSARPAAMVEAFQAERLVAYASLPTWPTYGRGWSRRAVHIAIQAVR